VADSIPVSGEIDIATVPDLIRRLDAAIDGQPGERIEVDFGRVTFVDSSGLGALVAAQRRARANGGDVSVTNLKPNLRTVFELTGLDKVLLAPAEVA
jgi:anti-sigma B factor antagonist